VLPKNKTVVFRSTVLSNQLIYSYSQASI